MIVLDLNSGCIVPMFHHTSNQLFTTTSGDIRTNRLMSLSIALLH